MNEIWREIPGWAGQYEVSDMGHVRSLDRTITVLNPFGVLAARRFRGRVLRAGVSKNGYPLVSLTRPGERQYRYVHHLVAEAFLGPTPVGREIRHDNGVRADCRLANILFGSRSENALDRHRHGTMNLAHGEEHYFHKLTEEDVRWIRANSGKLSYRNMAETLDVHYSTVSNADKGVYWWRVD